MACEQYKASAPGSIMLFGEHAVLHGEPAIAAAVNKYITVTLRPRQDQVIRIESDQFSSYETTIQAINVESPYRFILAAIHLFIAEMSTGFDLNIQSEFSPTLGLGSSAAVTVASLAVLNQWLNQPITQQQLALQARQIIRAQQGHASGADVVASVYGGVIYYETEPFHVESLTLSHHIGLVYCGYKTKTAEVIKHVNELSLKNTQAYQHYYQQIGRCTRQVKQSLQESQSQQFFSLVEQHQQLQAALGTSDATLEEIISRLRASETVGEVKISGSGLGDCVVAFGDIPTDFQQELKQFNRAKVIPIEITQQGLTTYVD